MTPIKSSIVHREVILLCAPPAQVKEFILTPERILDYYPSAIDCGVIEPGSSFFCRGKSGVSLLELDTSQSSERTVVLRVTTAMKLDPPFTAKKIKDATFFTMVEDWEVEPHELGSRLTKTWRDIKKKRLKYLPLRSIVKKSARAETKKLKLAWDRAAQPSSPGHRQ
jgi:hypothetical protein